MSNIPKVTKYNIMKTRCTCLRRLYMAYDKPLVLSIVGWTSTSFNMDFKGVKMNPHCTKGCMVILKSYLFVFM